MRPSYEVTKTAIAHTFCVRTSISNFSFSRLASRVWYKRIFQQINGNLAIVIRDTSVNVAGKPPVSGSGRAVGIGIRMKERVVRQRNIRCRWIGPARIFFFLSLSSKMFDTGLVGPWESCKKWTSVSAYQFIRGPWQLSLQLAIQIGPKHQYL